MNDWCTVGCAEARSASIANGALPLAAHPMYWPVFSLGNVCPVRRGTTITQNQANPGEIPVVAGGLAPTYFHDTPNRGCNVITVSASGANAGFVNYWETPIFASDCSTVESESPDVSIKYIFHFLRGKQEYIYSKLRSGAAQPHVYAKDIAALEIPLPPLHEQRRIAAILDQADALRAKRREALAQLDSLTQSIFIEMFGDALRSSIRYALSSLIEDFRYGTSNKSGTNGYPALRIPNVTSGSLELTELKTVEVDDAEFQRLRLRDGDLLFVRTNGNPDYVGRCAVFNPLKVSDTGFDSSEFIYASYLIRARLKESTVLPIVLQEYLSTAEGRRALRARSKTSAGQFNINTEGLGALPIPSFPIPLQESFVLQKKSIEQQQTIHRESLAELDALFSSLQHRAFRGEL